jgi:hypothetical protein
MTKTNVFVVLNNAYDFIMFIILGGTGGLTKTPSDTRVCIPGSDINSQAPQTAPATFYRRPQAHIGDQELSRSQPSDFRPNALPPDTSLRGKRRGYNNETGGGDVNERRVGSRTSPTHVRLRDRGDTFTKSPGVGDSPSPHRLEHRPSGDPEQASHRSWREREEEEEGGENRSVGRARFLIDDHTRPTVDVRRPSPDRPQAERRPEPAVDGEKRQHHQASLVCIHVCIVVLILSPPMSQLSNIYAQRQSHIFAT